MTKVCLISFTVSILTSAVLAKPTEQIFEDDDLQNFSWEYIDLTILSRVAKRPEGTFSDFHVITATFLDNKDTYTMHLNRPHGLLGHKQLTKSNDEGDKCIYEGSVNKLIGNGRQESGGSLAFSSCNHHEHSGFEGLLLLNDHHYYIKPDVNQTNDIEATTQSFSESNSSDTQPEAIKSDKPTIRHKAYKLSSNSQSFDNYFDETLEVPPEEVNKWVKNQTINFEELLDEENTTKHTVPMAIRSKTFYVHPVAVETTTQKVVELAIFTDAKLYNKWSQRFPRDTTRKLRQHVLAVVNNMNALYNQPSMTERITFRLVNIEIATTNLQNLNDYDGQAGNFLRSFCAYAAERNLKGTLWDHALLLTGIDLQENGNQITAGMTWHSTMCVNGLSCSVIEGSSFASSFVSAHEIGHSLGMDHDGSELNSDCDSSSFIMSPTTGGGRTSWSKCSMRNLKQFLAEGNNGFNPPKCLVKKSSKPGQAINYLGTKLPGQQFPAEIQCATFCRNKCSPYITGRAPYNDICFLLHCQQKQGDKNIVEAIHPALEGTPCGDGKVCFEGKCYGLSVIKSNPYYKGLLV